VLLIFRREEMGRGRGSGEMRWQRDTEPVTFLSFGNRTKEKGRSESNEEIKVENNSIEEIK